MVEKLGHDDESQVEKKSLKVKLEEGLSCPSKRVIKQFSMHKKSHTHKLVA